MPAHMFQDVVSPQSGSHGNWYTLPLSLLAHGAIVAVLLVAPLIATDVLPAPRQLLTYTMPGIVPIVPSLPVPIRRSTPVAATANVAAVPLVAPETISAESGIVFDQSTLETTPIEGLVTMVGSPALVETPPPPPAPKPVEPVRPGGNIKPPTRVKYVAPVYPEMARANRVQGVVIVEAIIGTDGRVENLRVLRSHPLLDAAAVAAVRAWEYTPTLLNGKPTPVIMTVTVQFNLN